MLSLIGGALLGAMVWISTWSRDASGAFVTDGLPGYRFLPEILARLGAVGGGALCVGIVMLLVVAILARRARL
ncbi:hypothetical protein ACFQ4O_09190 [Methylopila musalis]|uniref:Uncharacterized protein n=1 Tax=Methylopila musalis TaxID=1134781 RepID=A0ABW3Z8B1_9HYPH